MTKDVVFGRPTKRSITIAGHETSISLEPIFWAAVEAAAVAEGVPLSALVARIDVERLGSAGGAPNLTSAIRQWLFARNDSGSRGSRADAAATTVGGQST